MNTTGKKLVSGALTIATSVWLSGALMLAPVAHGQTIDINSLLAEIARLTQLVQQLQASQGGSVVGSFSFTRDLTLGSTGADVKSLQQFLNSQGFQVAASGAGSPGNETMTFGPLTKAALAKFQTAKGITPPAGYFGPKTRSFITSMVVAPGPGQPPVVIPGTGLAIALSPTTPLSSTVLLGASNVPFLRFTISGSGTVNTITLTRTGPGAAADFASSGVYLLDETGARLTSGRTVNSTTQKVNFTGLNISVNGTRTFTVVAAISTTASAADRNAFEISAQADITGSASAGGAYPVRGNEIAVGGSSIGTVTVASSSLPADPKVGEQGAKLASFKITNNASADDVKLSRVTLRYAGAVSRSHLSNFQVKYAGAVVGTGMAINDKDLLVLNFSPEFMIERGQNRVFELFGDVSPASRAGTSETIKWYVEDTNDVVAVSSLYGSGAAVTNNFDSNNHQTIDVAGGQITITFNGPTQQDVATNGSDVTVLDFTVASANNVEVKNLRFTITSTAGGGTNEHFSDFKVVDNATGAVVAGPNGSNVTSGTTSIVLNDTWNISSGQSRRLRVTVDVGSSANLANDTLRVDLAAFAGTDIKNVDSNLDVSTSDIVPNGVTGNTHTAKAASLDVTLAGTPSSRTLTAGTSNVDLVSFNFRAISDNIQIRTIKVSVSSTLNAASAANVIDALGSLRLMVDGSQIGQTKGLSGSQPVTAEFTNLNYTITKGATKTILVNAINLSNTATSTDYHVFLNDLSTDVTAVDTQGNTLTLSGEANDAPSTVILTLGTPSLTVSRVGAGSNDTDALHVMAGGERVLTRLEFRATNGDVTVKKIQFGVSSASTNATATGLGDDVSGASLKMCTDQSCTSKSTVTGLDSLPIDATGERAGTVLAENSAGYFTIPRGQSRYFTLEADLNAVVVGSAEGADSGQDLYGSLRLSNFEAVSGNTTLTSFTTSSAAGGTGLGVAGTQKPILRAEPMLSVAAPSVISNMANGTNEVIKITVNANTNPIALKAFGINIAATAATVTTPSTANVIVTDLDTSQTIAIGSVSGSAITGGNSGDIYIVLTNPQIISPGTPKRLGVKVTVSDVSTTSGASRLSIQLDKNEAFEVNSALSNSTNLLSANGAYGATSTKSWVWADLSDDQTGGEGTTATQWANLYLLRPFPSDVFTISNG